MNARAARRYHRSQAACCDREQVRELYAAMHCLCTPQARTVADPVAQMCRRFFLQVEPERTERPVRVAGTAAHVLRFNDLRFQQVLQCGPK